MIRSNVTWVWPTVASCQRLFHVLDPNAHGPPVRLELFDLCQLHDSTSDIAQPLGRKVRARNVLYERPKVDPRVLLGVPIRCWICIRCAREDGKEREQHLRSEWLTPAE